ERCCAAIVKIRRGQLDISERRRSKGADVKCVPAYDKSSKLTCSIVLEKLACGINRTLARSGHRSLCKRFKADIVRRNAGVAIIHVGEKRESGKRREVHIESVANTATRFAAKQCEPAARRFAHHVD